MVEVEGVGQLVRNHRLEHPGRHLPKGGVDSDDPGLTAVTAPLGRLGGDETDLRDLGGVWKAGGDLARYRVGTAIGIHNVRARSAHELSSELENRLVELPHRDPMRRAH